MCTRVKKGAQKTTAATCSSDKRNHFTHLSHTRMCVLYVGPYVWQGFGRVCLMFQPIAGQCSTMRFYAFSPLPSLSHTRSLALSRATAYRGYSPVRLGSPRIYRDRAFSLSLSFPLLRVPLSRRAQKLTLGRGELVKFARTSKKKKAQDLWIRKTRKWKIARSMFR